MVGLAAQLLATSGPTLAAPEETRSPFVSLSLGRGAADFSSQTEFGSFDTGWSGGGTALQMTVGRSILDNVTLEAGYGVWRRSPASETEEVAVANEDNDRYLGLATVVASLYPQLGRIDGLSVRLGLGFGKGFAREAALATEEWGALTLLGVGYEVRVEHDFAVGLRVDYGFFGGRDALSGTVAFASAYAKLHFPRHF